MLSQSSFIHSLERRLLMCHGTAIDGIGVLGDSYSDEYCFYAPDRSTAQNWVEQLADDTHASFGKFRKNDPPGPRNAGFSYNWAIAGATSGQMVADGQVDGVTAQAASGKVDLVTMFIGGNDFREVFTKAATDPAAAAASIMPTVQGLLTNIGIGAATVLSPAVVAANPNVRLILTTIPKLSYLPEVKKVLAAIPQFQPLVDAVDSAVEFVNQQIKTMAQGNSRIAVNDFATWVDDAFAQPTFKVGNVVIDRDALFNPTNDPTCFILNDGLHPGTIVQGLLANLYVQTANDAFGTRLESLSTKDILKNAGLYQGPPKCNAPSVFALGKTIGHHCVDDVLN
jgi:phospholipase/lecithinase/hemolysin